VTTPQLRRRRFLRTLAIVAIVGATLFAVGFWVAQRATTASNQAQQAKEAVYQGCLSQNAYRHDDYERWLGPHGIVPFLEKTVTNPAERPVLQNLGAIATAGDNPRDCAKFRP
jgi:hypothetical protein